MISDVDPIPGRPSDGISADPVIEAYKKDVDRTLVRHMLSRTVEERLLALEAALRDLAELREAALVATA